MLTFTIWNVQSKTTCKSGRVPPHKSVYFGISKFILQFLYYFHAPCIVLFTVYFHLQCNVLSNVYFHTVFPCSSFFVTDSIRKQTLLTERFNFVFIKNLSSASQSNKQVVMAESQEQYILSNITYIKFRNFYFFYFFVYLEGDAPEMYTKHLKDICNGVHFFWQNCRLMVGSFTKNMYHYKYFPRFLLRFIVFCIEFLKILRTSVSQKTF